MGWNSLPVKKKTIRAARAYLLGKVTPPTGGLSLKQLKSPIWKNLLRQKWNYFPAGIPVRSSGWRRFPYLVENAEYDEWLEDFPNRTAPTPIADKTGACVILSVLLFGS